MKRIIRKNTKRSGFTLIELLVVISIIAVLASLIAPAVQSARRAARKMECSNNMRQVGIAIINFASGGGGSFPALHTSLSVTNSSGSTGVMQVGWPIQLLPVLDASALYKNIKSNAIVASGAAVINGSDTPDGVDDTTWIQVFTCPDDVDSFRQPGGLSYVVNSGWYSSANWGVTEVFTSDASASGYHQPGSLSWDGDGNLFSATDVTKHVATGVIWRNTGNFQSSQDYVSTGDGATTTIMLTENLQAGPWYSIDANYIGFGLRVYAPSNQPTSDEVVMSSGVPSMRTDTTNFGTPDAATRPDGWFINRDLAATPGTRPRPSSNHNGGVNIMMCDGSVRFLNENVDKNTYAKLLTSNGVNYGEMTLNQASY